jgi:hypothetical protein
LGNEEEYHVDGTTVTVEQLVINLKSIATEAQTIFTRGKISYSCAHNYISSWISEGKGDIDILASNIYKGGEGIYNNTWKTEITNLFNVFGTDSTYLTEFAPSYTSLADYSSDETVQAEAVTEMLEYIKASGITRALFFTLKDDKFGIIKND